MKWYNASTGVIAACEQLEPILNNGKVQRGRLTRTRDGEVFTHDENGADILHRAILGQIQVADDDPRVRPAGR